MKRILTIAFFALTLACFGLADTPKDDPKTTTGKSGATCQSKAQGQDAGKTPCGHAKGSAECQKAHQGGKGCCKGAEAHAAGCCKTGSAAQGEAKGQCQHGKDAAKSGAQGKCPHSAQKESAQTEPVK
ncbi:MAG: hypothetical protein KA419_08015 [Acidobacteria bacterium]|nr:hypothetical protein [Acidobacteriota bacterium]